ncbi:MAG: hypothetical protein JNM66_22290 [Bryobacterales bacterium]|nr:hypothetical protein [Bryobacterales bacterium]
MNDELWMEQLAAEAALENSAPASSCLKSKIYSNMILAMEEGGPLLPLPDTKQAGRALCVFEHLVEILPAPDSVQSLQYCKVCHAKALGERMENAPIYWPGCPYCEFQNR